MDLFSSPAEAAQAVGNKKTGVIEWDRGIAEEVVQFGDLRCWEQEEVSSPTERRVRIAADVECALRRFRPRIGSVMP